MINKLNTLSDKIAKFTRQLCGCDTYEDSR